MKNKNKKRTYKKRNPYEPYFRESAVMSILTVIFSICLAVYGIAFRNSPLRVIAVIVIFLSIIFINHGIFILSVIEKIFKLYKDENVIFENVKEYFFTPLGRDDGGYLVRLVRTFYDEKLLVDIYKVTGKREDGKKLVLTEAMSCHKCGIIRKAINDGRSFNITYGKLSKIIISYNGKDDTSFILTKKL